MTLYVAALTMPCDDGVRERLRAAALTDLTDARRAAYVGHLVLRCADWAVRKDRVEEIPVWMDMGDRLLPA
jgi:hypothetical protein